MTNDCSRTRDGSRGGSEGSTATEISTRPSVAIVEQIADEAGISPLGLRPLNDTIDADALDQLLDDADETANDAWPTVVFTYANHRVCVTADGQITLSSPSATDISVVDEWTHVSIVETSDEADVATRAVSAVAEHSGRDLAKVRSAIGNVVDIDAIARLGEERGNGASRSGATVLFSVLGYDVVVESNGTIAVGSTLKRLKQTGGNVLIAGAVPDALTDVASANLLGDPERGRRHVFALLDRDGTVVPARLGSTDATAARVVDYTAASRSAASAQPTVDGGPAVTDEPTDLDELGTAIETEIRALVAGTALCEPGELRLCVDSLRPVLDQRDAEEAVAFLEPICESVRGVSGLAHYVLPVDRDEPVVRTLESLFDATIELRVTESGPEQRWHLHESHYTTDWFPLAPVQ
ncbi:MULTISPECIES: DUF7504 family protein [Natrialbaceae]|uniref:DUF7504 family protein n=1 Tax=Natrialbaceae TaxID=1644061 RepID=UPI00207CE15E|nr:HalOD1 output domain-containing protein [Natronococcus sp. CG52]